MKKVRGENRGGNPSASDILGKQSEYTDLSGGHAPTDKEIQLRAYWIHLDRDGQHGYDLDDWLQAERELAEGRCNEVRGGNHKFIGTRKLPGMVAWVASIPINEGEGGGDVHFMSVCSHDLISRVAIADVSGHGREVDLAAITLHELMRKNIDVWGQSDFLRGLNDTFNRDGDGQYATAIVLGFHWVTGHLAFSNAGQLPPLWYHASDRAWGWLEEGDPTPHEAFGLPVGLIPGTGYCQTVVTLRPSDLLVLYTDGITDAENGAGNGLGREQLLEWAREGPVESPRTLGEQLLKRLTEFRGNRHNDDETLLVLQREKESAPTLA